MVSSILEDFKPTLLKGIIIGITEYSGLRDRLDLVKDSSKVTIDPEDIASHDLPVNAVKEDIKLMQMGLERLGFKDENILTLTEPDSDKIKNALKKVKNEVLRESSKGGRTCVFIYYGGHGAIDDLTYCVTGDGKPCELEKMIRGLSADANSYYFGLFDCCRDKVTIKTMNEIHKLKGNKRGKGLDALDSMLDEFADEGDEVIPDAAKQNYIISFGCAPGLGVKTESNLVKSFLTAARQFSQSTDGIVKFPKALQLIRYEDSGRRRDSA